MSHGNSGILVCSDDETLPIQSIHDVLASCHTLWGKPKIGFFQPCRGELEDVGVPFRANNQAGASLQHNPLNKTKLWE